MLKAIINYIIYIFIYIIIIISVIVFLYFFIHYNKNSMKVYENSLEEIKKMYFANYDNNKNSIISNYNIINNRIIFLQERIAHYQNDSNHFASLWLTLLSLLFIIVTGFNLYNYNEQKKILEKDIEKLEIILKNNEPTVENAQKIENSGDIKGLSDKQEVE